jgi:hypothetical protein
MVVVGIGIVVRVECGERGVNSGGPLHCYGEGGWHSVHENTNGADALLPHPIAHPMLRNFGKPLSILFIDHIQSVRTRVHRL